MVSWFYAKSDLKATPSLLDGIAYDVEMAFRKEGARFIMDLGNKIGLRYDSVATGVIFLHRFYMFHSFKEFDRYVTACCCLFLAGKVEETPKKCKDIIKMAKSLLSESKFAAFGVDPKEEVMTMERILLQTIKFDLQVEHPYTYLIKYAKCLKGDKMKLHKCVQMAWTFVNDSLCTTLSLQWEPEIIAIALMYLAGKLSKFEVVDWVGRHPHHLRWWDMFVQDMSMELLEDVCHQVLDLYTQTNRPRPDSSSMPSVFKQQISGEHNKSNAEAGTGGTPTKKDSTKRKSSAVNTPPAPSNKLPKQDQSTAPAAASSSTPSSSTGPVTAAGPAVHSPSLQQQQQLPSGFQYGSAPPISAAVGTAAGYGFPSYGAVSTGGMSASVTAVAPPLPGTPGGAAGKYPGQQQQLMAQQQPPYVAYGYPPSAVGDSNTAGMPPLPPPPPGKFTALPPHALGGLPHPPPHPPYPPAAASRPPPRGYFGPPPGFGPPGGGYQPPRRPF